MLLIDDDPADRRLFARVLRKAGFELLETGSVEAAMSAIVRGGVGCVVTDQVMPISGLELARSAQQARSDIGLVFISGAGPKPGLPESAIFVSKDDRDEVVRAVERCMARWRVDQ